MRLHALLVACALAWAHLACGFVASPLYQDVTYDFQPQTYLSYQTFHDELVEMTISSELAGAYLGGCIAAGLDSAGQVVAVVSAMKSTTQNARAGSAIIFSFDRTINNTNHVIKFPKLDPTLGAQNFGTVCAAAPDGAHVVLATDNGGQGGRGRQTVYVYTRNVSSEAIDWSPTGVFNATEFGTVGESAYFASSVAVTNGTLFIAHMTAGKVVVLTFVAATSSWTPLSAVVAPPAVGGSMAFGYRVSAVWPYLAVSAPGWNSGLPGLVALYNFSAVTGAVRLESVVAAPLGLSVGEDEFGVVTALTTRPVPILAVGMPAVENSGGVVVLFTRNATTGRWSYWHLLRGPGLSGESFGMAIALDSATGALVVGSPFALEYVGVAQVFSYSRNSTLCALLQSRALIDGWAANATACMAFLKDLTREGQDISQAGGVFGGAVGVAANNAIVGAPNLAVVGGMISVFSQTGPAASVLFGFDAMAQGVVKVGPVLVVITPRDAANWTRVLGGDNVTVWAQSLTSPQLPRIDAVIAHVVGDPYAAYLPLTVKGTYTVWIQVNALVYSATVVADHLPASIGACSVVGPGVDPAHAGYEKQEKSFTIVFRDLFGNEMDDTYDFLHPDALSFGILVESASQRANVSAVALNASAVALTYTPPLYGTYSIIISVNDEVSLPRQMSFLAFCDSGFYAKAPLGPCDVCAAGQFSAGGNSSACDPCPEFTTTSNGNASAVSACLCFPGYYTLDGPGARCALCPANAVCVGQLERPVAAPGAYQVDATTFVLCSPSSACLGGNASACARGYGGFQCASCLSGFYRSGVYCRACTDSTRGLFGLMFALGAVVGGLFVALAAVANHSAGGGVKQRLRHSTWSVASLTAIVTFCQMIGVVAEVPASWPDSVSSLLAVFKVFNLIDVGIFAPACSIEPNFFRTYLLSVCAPLYVLACMGLWIAGVNAAHALTQRLGRAAFWSSDQLRVFNRRTSVLSVFVALPFVYIGIARAALRFFSCRLRADGRWYIGSETTTRCFVGEWLSMLPLAITAVLVYDVGIPLLVAVALIRNRNTLNSQVALTRFGAVYRLYAPEYFWWETIAMTKKLALVAVQTLFTSQLLQVALLLFLFGAAAMVQLHLRPFYRRRHNRLAAVLDTSLAALMFCGLVFLSGQLPNSYTRAAFIAATFAVVIGAIALLGASAVQEMHGNLLVLRSADGGASIADFRRDAVLGAIRPVVMGRMSVDGPADAAVLAQMISDRVSGPSAKSDTELMSMSDADFAVGQSAIVQDDALAL